jgi:hypothetical protein
LRNSGREATYSDCGEDILKLVHKCNQPRVVHVDAVYYVSFPHYEGLSQTCAYAFGFVAMVGGVRGEVVQVQAVFAVYESIWV